MRANTVFPEKKKDMEVARRKLGPGPKMTPHPYREALKADRKLLNTPGGRTWDF